MNLVALPAFADNYIWMLHDGRQAVVVDPGDAAPVVAALDAQGLTLAAILVTHHHADHTGGVQTLRPLLADAADSQVWGPARETMPQPCRPLQQGDRPQVAGLPPNLHVEVLDVPGHTAGHIAYVLRRPGRPALLFCGDTLFSAGCGRLFEGTAAQMFDSLAQLAALPDDTRVCCTHEYTEANLRFAAAVEPDNPDIAQATSEVAALRAAGLPSLPSSIGRERLINPFMRCSQAAVVAAARLQGAANDSGPAVLGALREWKNQFR